jgi:hypothetical protein
MLTPEQERRLETLQAKHDRGETLTHENIELEYLKERKAGQHG